MAQRRWVRAGAAVAALLFAAGCSEVPFTGPIAADELPGDCPLLVDLVNIDRLPPGHGIPVPGAPRPSGDPGEQLDPWRDVTAAGAATIIDHAGRSEDLEAGRVLAGVRDVVAWPLRARVELPTSGIVVDVHSDGPVEVDTRELDRLAALPLLRYRELGDQRMRILWDCYRRRIIGDRELEGTHLRMFVTSDPSWCISGGTVGPRPGPGKCVARGVSIPAVDVSVGRSQRPLVRMFSPATVVLAPGGESHVASVLLHELVHVYDNAMGITPTVEGLRPYEQRAYYVQGHFDAMWREADEAAPQPLRFPAAP